MIETPRLKYGMSWAIGESALATVGIILAVFEAAIVGVVDMKPDLRDNVIDCHRSRGRSRVMCSDLSYLAVGNAYVITIRLPCSISQHLC